MKTRNVVIALAGLMTLNPNFIYAASGDAAEKIGTKVIAVLFIIIVFGLISWVKSKNNKEDNNKPL